MQAIAAVRLPAAFIASALARKRSTSEQNFELVSVERVSIAIPLPEPDKEGRKL
jgi:hypothetical protein